MDLAGVQAVLAAHRAELHSQGVSSLRVFGSVARAEQRLDSDVDMLVEFERPAGMFALIELRLQLEEWLGCPVDLGTSESLRPSIRNHVLQEAVRVA